MGLAVKKPSIQNYRTPNFIFNGICDFLGIEFNIDAFADEKNKLCEKYFDESSNGFVQKWHGNVWCNPPYKNGFMQSLIRKIKDERANCDTIAVLCIAATGTIWFHEALEMGAKVIFYRRRIQFEHELANNKSDTENMVLIFERESEFNAKFNVGCSLCGRVFDDILLCKCGRINRLPR